MYMYVYTCINCLLKGVFKCLYDIDLMNKGKMENKTQNLTVTLTVLVSVYLILISIELG